MSKSWRAQSEQEDPSAESVNTHHGSKGDQRPVRPILQETSTPNNVYLCDNLIECGMHLHKGLQACVKPNSAAVGNCERQGMAVQILSCQVQVLERLRAR